MLNKTSLYRFLCVVTVTMVSGCATTGPANDDWETSENFKKGPGLFSKQEGVYTISLTQEQDKTADTLDEINDPPAISTTKNVPAPEKSDEFESFQQWKKARDSNSEEYQRFLKWREYEDYLEWKRNQTN